MSSRKRSSRLSNTWDLADTVQQALVNLTSTAEYRGANLKALATALSSASIYCPTELDKVRDSCEVFALKIIETSANNCSGSSKLVLTEGQIFFLQVVHANDSGIGRFIVGLENIVSKPTRAKLGPIWMQVKHYSNFRFLADKDPDMPQHIHQDDAPSRPILTLASITPRKPENGYKWTMDFPCAF